MTAEPLAAAILRDVTRWTKINEVVLSEPMMDESAVLAALSRAMSDDLAERAGEVLKRLNTRMVKTLPDDWQKGRKCPDCGSDADRPKCLWEHGPSCARHDPDAYDPPAWEKVPDRDCKNAADLITALLAQNAALRAERDEAVTGMMQAGSDYRVALLRADRMEAAIDYILDGMAINAPDYEIDPDDEFLDAADNDWVRDVLSRLAAAMKGTDHE